MERFAGKTVIVTGAGSGIGEGAARRFSQEGANVVLAGRTEGKLKRVAADLDAERTLIVVTDVSEEASVDALVAGAIERFGQLDVMVNNAGIAEGEGFLESSVEDWRATMGTNVDGVFFGCRAALPHLLKTGGSIVNTSSVSGLGGDWGMSFYNASKGAVSNLTRALALEFGARGVRVNAIAPSLTASELTQDMLDDKALIAKFKDRIPLGRPAEPADIAGVIAFLASEDARFVNGVILPVDGGLMASNGQPNMG